MDYFFLILIAILAGILFLWLLPWLIYGTARLVTAVFGTAAGAVSGSFQSVGNRFGFWQFQRSILNQATDAFKRSGIRQSRRSRTDPDVYALAALLKEAVGNCNMIHHYAADALGVEHMHELQDHMVCAAHRERVVQITDTTMDRLLRADLIADVTAAKMSIGLDRMRDICTDCVLLKYSRRELRALCDPAIHMGCMAGEERR